ncbi:transcriptional regulator [Enemella evansiae]|uniref:Transcriptional regulator n=1 Tax=Enemella evansiae TaxID=2016499 RepID=A0A255GJK5_9ACTN|nr:TetR family transcriptional regulator [Enemella evansiae]OYO14726.1 transcriptional regulator [Enemella evansiae]
MPRQVDHDARRTEIVQGVWLVIARDGLAAVSMRTVAAAAGVSVGRIQHYFASKEELLRVSARAMIEAGTDRYREDTEQASPAGRLREALGHPIRRAAEPGPGVSIWYAYLTASATDAEIAAILAEGKRGQETLVAGLLGELGAPRRSALRDARALIALADGLTERVLIGDLTTREALAVLTSRLPD